MPIKTDHFQTSDMWHGKHTNHWNKSWWLFVKSADSLVEQMRVKKEILARLMKLVKMIISGEFRVSDFSVSVPASPAYMELYIITIKGRTDGNPEAPTDNGGSTGGAGLAPRPPADSGGEEASLFFS